jgi:predicted Zn-dependent protease
VLQNIVQIKESPGLEWARIGQLRMTLHDTKGAIRAFEAARSKLADDFTFHLELGMLYMADRRFNDAAKSLDNVSSQHPGYSMALFKRAQASVLLKEPDRENRVRQAWIHADKTTRPMFESERLFQNIQYR